MQIHESTDMITDPDRALVAAVITTLRAAPTLTARVGAGIVDDPQASPPAPYVLVGRTEARPWGGAPASGSAEAVELTLTLTAVSRFDGHEEARAIAGVLRSLLHDAALTLDGWRLANLRVVFVDVYRAADGRTVLGVARLRAVVEPL